MRNRFRYTVCVLLAALMALSIMIAPVLADGAIGGLVVK